MIGMFIINMGFDGLISFLIRNLPNDAFDDIDLNINHNKILSDYILVDISFILYNCYIEIEDEINDIIKFICGLSTTNYTKIISLIETKLGKDHWKNLKIKLDGENQDEICKNFIKCLTENENDILDKILLNYVCKRIQEIIDNIFAVEFSKKIILFFDSIPSYSKIIEQRKRRLLKNA